MANHSPSVKSQLHPLIQNLATVIIEAWETHFKLEPLALPEGLGYIEGQLEGEKLTIQNFCYQTPQFRKLHLELAKVGKHLDILHCVMFPHAQYPLPMFGCDLVGGRGGIGAAIVDLSPTNKELTLSGAYREKLDRQPVYPYAQVRELPEWGDIFSDVCLFIRPTSPQEETAFLDHVRHFLTVHCELSLSLPAVSESDRAMYLAGQQYYCQKQQKNDKTRRVLEQAFDPEWAERYLTGVLFDVPTA